MPALDDLRAIAAARTRGEFESSLTRVAHEMGFPLFGVIVAVDQPGRASALAQLSNPPPAFEQAWLDAPASMRDPVLHELRQSALPVIWNEHTYARAGAADLWDLQAPFGYRVGLAVALHLPRHRHFVLGLDRERNLPTENRRLSRLLADVQLLAVHAQVAAQRLLIPAMPPPPRLTPRELDVLHWTMLGKDAAAIGQILDISRYTVQFHVENAIAKLDCETKHAAVLKALEHGLLDRLHRRS
ncbi:MAG: autoinducer binding domain-containing protein [Burkholderiaceae bacterium]|nr:autoinducer binding domain-containing protein [Aquabacterium sp.]NUP87323.1 autoinducer binding domain-containing protein [Burkholderiaceae bacterium]